MKKTVSGKILLMLVLIAGLNCHLISLAQEPAKPADTHKFKGKWFSLEYPHGWEITADEELEGSHFILLQPELGNSLAMITRFPASHGFTLTTHSATAVERWKTQFPAEDIRDLRVEDGLERFGAKGRKVTAKVRTLMGWESITHEFYGIDTTDSFYFIHFQAPDSERTKGVQEDLDGILRSLTVKTAE